MLTRLGFAINYALGRDIAGRAAMRFPDDIFLVAYPGSGGQWLRRLVANLVELGRPVTPGDILHRVPSLYDVPRRALIKVPRPRIIFSHESFDSDCRSKVVYVIRDPRDVAVSIYNQRQRGRNGAGITGIEQFLSNWFMRTDHYQGGWAEDFSGAIREDRGFVYRSRLKEGFLGTPASWGENVMSWFGARGNDPSTLLKVHYEDLFFDAESVLLAVSEYLNLGRSPEEIREALRVSYANSEVMPEKPGEWKTNLPPASVHEIESAWGSVMSVFGYSVSAEADSACANPAGANPVSDALGPTFKRKG
jgi:Sulfotransferase domain